MTGLWPDGPLPVLPHEVVRRVEVAYRVVAHRGQRTKQLGMADGAHLDAFVAAERAALPGWRIEVLPEEFERLVSGADNETPANTGR